MDWRGFGFVHHSRTLFCRAVPNPNLTIRKLLHRRTAAPPWTWIAQGAVVGRRVAAAAERHPVVAWFDQLVHQSAPVVWTAAATVNAPHLRESAVGESRGEGARRCVSITKAQLTDELMKIPAAAAAAEAAPAFQNRPASAQLPPAPTQERAAAARTGWLKRACTVQGCAPGGPARLAGRV
jgi:hypothetical protein